MTPPSNSRTICSDLLQDRAKLENLRNQTPLRDLRARSHVASPSLRDHAKYFNLPANSVEARHFDVLQPPPPGATHSPVTGCRCSSWVLPCKTRCGLVPSAFESPSSLGALAAAQTVVTPIVEAFFPRRFMARRGPSLLFSRNRTGQSAPRKYHLAGYLAPRRSHPQSDQILCRELLPTVFGEKWPVHLRRLLLRGAAPSCAWRRGSGRKSNMCEFRSEIGGRPGYQPKRGKAKMIGMDKGFGGATSLR